ncbi:hypothetical protein ABB02_01724 [Clostridiaceae bacterium JG1575]|nr:hypothetical protein ABB02_01724 [Clostridiaceae bacterium JG1575]
MFQEAISLMGRHFSDIRWIGLIFLFAIGYGFLNRPWFGKKPFSLVLPLDKKIPFVPWTIVPYNFWYPILLPTCVCLAIWEKPQFYHFLSAYALGSFAAFLIFLFFQNEVPRTNSLEGSAFSRWLLRLTWRMDRPYNGFPSIHVFACTLTLLAVFASSFPLAGKLFIAVSQPIIMASTLTTKQHVVLDVLGGAFLAWLSWTLSSGLLY